jgi:hypothetical protein
LNSNKIEKNKLIDINTYNQFKINTKQKNNSIIVAVGIEIPSSLSFALSFF